MKVRNAPSLAARLTLVQVVVLGALWLVIIGLTVLSTYRRGEGDIDVELHLIAASIARLTPDHASAADAARIGEQIAAINMENADPKLEVDEFAYQIWNADGQLLARSQEQPQVRALTPSDSLEVAASTLSGWFVQSAWNHDHSIYAVVGKQRSYYHRRVWNTVSELALLWLAIAVVFSLAFWWAFRAVIRPVSKSANRIAARSPSDLSPIDTADTFQEISPLITALNQKLEQIRKMLDVERQFFLDAAHELRTPLAVIAAQAHVLAHESEVSSRLEALTVLEGGIERSARVVSRLLTLGRLESAQALPNRASHDIAAIAASVVDAQQARAMASQHTLALQADDEAIHLCDAESIAVLIENLVDNSLRYCPPGSAIKVSVISDVKVTKIIVSDNGPGIAYTDRQRAFTRFQRIDSTGTNGSGLGLAIVLRIAELHEATVSIVDSPNDVGTMIEVRLPFFA